MRKSQTISRGAAITLTSHQPNKTSRIERLEGRERETDLKVDGKRRDDGRRKRVAKASRDERALSVAAVVVSRGGGKRGGEEEGRGTHRGGPRVMREATVERRERRRGERGGVFCKVGVRRSAAQKWV